MVWRSVSLAVLCEPIGFVDALLALLVFVCILPFFIKCLTRVQLIMLRCDFLCLSFTLIHLFLEYRNTVVHQLKARIMDDLPSWSVRVQLLSVGVSLSLLLVVLWRSIFFFVVLSSERGRSVLHDRTDYDTVKRRFRSHSNDY